ncbi:MAG TPA: hypothetical protein ENI87_08390 [bacterium]|nr:hypothetical protein [bacterium]
MTETIASTELERLRARHLRYGWLGLFVFVVLGGVLEALHGFKVDWYLAVGNETTRLMWRLAHAHGTFLSLVHVAFAVSIAHAERPALLASRSLLGATIALPGGFLLGAFGADGGDPGLGIALVPLGLVMLLVAIVATLRGLRR